MNKKKLLIVTIVLLFVVVSPLVAEANHIRIRTIAGMEPFGRMTSQHWSIDNATKHWDTTYGFSPGLEFFVILGDVVEVGAGFKYQLDRRVHRDGGNDDELFRFLPLYAAVRLKVMDIEKIDMHTLLRLGYAFFSESQGFRDIWISEGGPLTSTSGGMYGSVALGVTITLLNRPSFGLDYSMDAGYAFHGASGTIAASGKSYPIALQALVVDFALDWRF